MITLARNAMATRFEILLHGDNPVSLRAAGEEALEEIDRLESQLSLYRPTSEIGQLNARAAHESVQVSPRVFALLQHAHKLYEETQGAFDITIAPLARCWGFMNGLGRMPSADELAEARSKIGMSLVHLNPAESTVHFARQGVMLDLGAIGKGYAIECAADLLREAGVTSALLHGGTSTIYGLGHPPEAETWKIAIENPLDKAAESEASSETSANQFKSFSLPSISLHDQALSVSAIWGRSFQKGGKIFGHVLDPRTGEPVAGALLAAVVLPSGTETDALSTALLVRGTEGHNSLCKLRPGIRTLLVTQSKGEVALSSSGLHSS
jgi:thiamine biosynthesis lipoprotein